MFLLIAACATLVDSKAPADSNEDTSEPSGPGPAFDRFCLGTDWETTRVETTVPDGTNHYTGYIDNSGNKKGTVESSKIIPAHPFYARTLRVRFGFGTGTARLRLMETMGRSYPANYPDLDTEGGNLIDPIEVEVDEDGTGEEWTEIDISGLGVFLEPTQHYVIVNEYPTKASPTVAIETLRSAENSRALLIMPDEDTPYGLDGNYMMELVGDTFCSWPDEDRQFQPVDAAFADDVSGYAAIADLDGDHHQDVVTYGAGPRAWMGDGRGNFTEKAGLWPEASYATWMLFGDVDNDGDPDAFAANYVGADNDGDGVTVSDGDCNDLDAAIHPGATEATNSRDDDCDGIADDGLDVADADADGVSIAAGDCDDTLATMAPGLAETEDSLDNDCDLSVDEDFPSRILLNDGTAQFTAVPGSGVEVREPTTAGGFGDGNEDGLLDLYFGNWLEHYPDDTAVQDRYYEGDGDGTFTDARESAGLLLPVAFSCYGMEWNDYNNDAHPDMLVANYHLYDNQLWQNQGDGTFVDVALAAGVAHDEIPTDYAEYPGGHSYGGDFGDVDNDGDMDYYQTNLSHPRTQPWADPSTFNVNSGAPDFTFTNEREAAGFIYDEGDINAQFADYDNDMDLDLAIASLYGTHYARVYRNDGGAFTDVSYELGVNVEVAVSVVWVDVDEDGDEDLIVADGFREPYVNLFRNDVGQANHWVDLRLEGTTTNRDAAGARVSLTAGGVTQLREIQDGNGSFNTQRPRIAHFGLAGNTAVDTVTVHWVGGALETFSGVGTDGTWTLVEGSGVAVHE